MMAHAISVTVRSAVAGLALCAAACAPAHTEPPPGPPPAPPAVGAACGADLDGALTALPKAADDLSNQQHLLACGNGTWQPFDDPYPSSDRWLSTGPELVLHGQGRRNPEVHGGTWTATPQTADTPCGAEIVDVVGAGKTSAPQQLTAEPGQPLTINVSDHMFTVRLTGYCLWRKS
jgi:hypothetical protein